MIFDEIIQELRVLLNMYEMAQKQGTDEYFTYYTLDNEPVSHRPHVHICVSKNDKHWKGKNFRNGQKLKTVGSVYLPYEQIKNRVKFTPDNLEFEEVEDAKVKGTKYVKAICAWLNAVEVDEFGSNATNAVNSFRDYKKSNGDTCIYLKKLGL